MADWIQQNFPDIYRIGMQGVNSWPDAIYATLYMTVISFIIGGLLGLVMGLFLVLTGPRGVIEAAQARGATLWDTIKVYLGEGLPELVRVSTVTLISLVGETAMAGAIGAGGLGYIAIYYGYNRSSTSVTILATFLILILIFLIQFLGDFLTRKLSHK